jgi:hypothetical protein
MRRRLAAVVAGLLGFASPVLIAACGGDERLIPGDSAERLQSSLDDVRSSVAAGDCDRASQALLSAQDEAARLPSTVDPRLRRRLISGVGRLTRLSEGECRDNARTTPTETTTTPTITTTTTTTTAPPPTTTTAPPTTTTEPPPPTTTEPPPETVPPETTTGTGGDITVPPGQTKRSSRK